MAREINLDAVEDLDEDELLYAAQHNLLKPHHLDALGWTDADVRATIQGTRNPVPVPESERLVLTDPEEIRMIQEHRGTLPGETPKIEPVGLGQIEETDEERAAKEKRAERKRKREAAPTDYDSLTVEELQVMCVERKPPLSLEGRKADLIARLQEDDAKGSE